MILKTKHKIFLASLAYYPIRWSRAALGKPDSGRFQRGGFQWQLDLGEVVDFMIFLKGSFEASLRDFICRNLSEGMVAFDIGANVGAHTLVMGRSVGPHGQVHGIEATEYAFGKLDRNIALNPAIAPQISAHHCMLVPSSDQAKERIPADAIHSSWPFRSDEERHDSHRGVFKSIGNARKICLDDLSSELDLSRLDFIKLDVDGNEWDVLSGGLATFERFSPLIVMEVAPDYHPADDEKSFLNIHQLLASLDYRFYRFNGKPLPSTAEELVRSIPSGASRNVVAVRKGSQTPRFT